MSSTCREMNNRTDGNTNVSNRATCGGGNVSECRLYRVGKRKRQQNSDPKQILTNYTKSIFLNVSQKLQARFSASNNKLLLLSQFQNEIQEYIDIYNGIDLYFQFMRKFTKIVSTLYKDSKNVQTRETAVYISRENSSLEQLNRIYKSRPVRLKNKPTSISNNRSTIINVFLYPNNDAEFRDMTRKIKKTIVSCSDTTKNKFIEIKYTDSIEEIIENLRLYDLKNYSCKFYVFGHGDNVGRVGTKTTPLLNRNALLRCLDVYCAGFKFRPPVILTFCFGHFAKRKNFKNIAVDFVTDKKKPLALYYVNYNISLMCYLLHEHFCSIYNI